MLLIINWFLVLFQYSYKLWYSFLYLIWNSFFFKKLKSYLILDLNFFSTEWLHYDNFSFKGDGVEKLSFLKKYLLSVYPDVTSKNYSYNNNSVIYLSNFRHDNFPIIDEVVENNFNQAHSISLKEFNKLGNFILNSNYSNNNFKKFLSKSFKGANNTSIIYNLYSFIFFCSNNFYFRINVKHFFTTNRRNFVKFNFLFLYFLSKLDKNLSVVGYKLDNVFNWFSYSLDEKFNFIKSFSLRNYNSSNSVIISKNSDTYKKNLYKLVSLYDNFSNGSKFFLTDMLFNFKKLNSDLVAIDNNFSKVFSINFSEASTNKFINLTDNFLKRSDFVFFFLRKNKIFNKGRYSRNRQTYRTGFYWCLWVNIFAIYGLHYLCYRFTFAFGYLWLPLIIFFGSFVFGRMLKYNFHNLNHVVSEVYSFSNWLGLIINNFYNSTINFSKSFLAYFNNLLDFSLFKNKSFFLFNSFNKLFKYLRESLTSNINSLEHVHVWYYLSSQDTSTFKLSSKLFFLNQFFFKK